MAFRPHGWLLQPVVTGKSLRKVLRHGGIRSYQYDRARLCNDSVVHIYSGDNHLQFGLHYLLFWLRYVVFSPAYPSNGRPDRSSLSVNTGVLLHVIPAPTRHLECFETLLWNEVSRNAEEQWIINSRLFQIYCALKLA
jgi:hypothetical protein